MKSYYGQFRRWLAIRSNDLLVSSMKNNPSDEANKVMFDRALEAMNDIKIVAEQEYPNPARRAMFYAFCFEHLEMIALDENKPTPPKMESQ